MDAIELLKQDHRRVEQLFSDFLDTESDVSQEDLLREIQTELNAHADAEELAFYPMIRPYATAQIDEALKEHQRVKEVLAELLAVEVNEDEFESRFTELIEDVRHHVEEEEAAGGIMDIAREQLDEVTLARMASEIQKIKRRVEDELAA